MKADVVFIGGGLAALTAGIKLLKAGKSVIIVSAGQSALHFSSGSFCLLNKCRDKKVERPLDHIDTLPASHPYIKAGGRDAVVSLLEDAYGILSECGINLKGTHEYNHHRLTPFGVFTPSWLTLSDHLTLEEIKDKKYGKASIIGIDGFLDFYPSFLAKGLSRLGVESLISSVNIEDFNILRANPTELRAPNIARSLTDDGIERYAAAINRNIRNCDFALIPAVVGLNDTEHIDKLKSLVRTELYSVSTIPVSVPGIRMKLLLQETFTDLGGWYLLGDSVSNGTFNGNRLESINTANLGNTPVRAEHFVLSTGGLFSRGLKSTSEKIYEPLFNIDIIGCEDRAGWYDKNFYKPQPFMKSGVSTDNQFRCLRDGVTVDNLYAAGGILGGDFDPLSDGVGAGVTLVSALSVADIILKGDKNE